MNEAEYAQPDYCVGPGLMPDFVTGARLYAVLGWPNRSECSARDEAAAALASGVIALTAELDPASRDELALEYPTLVGVSEQARKRALRSFRRRLDHRMAAARMSLGFLFEAIASEPARLPEPMRGHSLNELSKLIRSDTHIDDPENIEKLVWRKSLPVIHLAAAFQM